MANKLTYSLFFFVLLAGNLIHGQKETIEVIDSEELEVLNIQTNEVFRIQISSEPVDKIQIRTRSEGEYYNSIQIETSVVGKELKIITRYPERLTGGFDKLSAHKVFSLEIELVVPQGMEVVVTSNIASLTAHGRFNSIYAALKQGYCKLLDFTGKAVVNTYSGDILVETGSGLINAKTRNGKLALPDFLPGRNPIRLTSIDGDITVRKTK